MRGRRAGSLHAIVRRVIPQGLLCSLASSCALAPSPAASGSGEPLPPPGYGTLRQDEVTVAFSSGDLEIKVTPLDESVILVTAPDTYQRLARLADMHESETARPGEGPGVPLLFLVSFFSDSPDVAFVPEELQLISRGLRFRPTAIRPVTPGWGQRRLQQRRTETAVYVFPSGVDLESDLTVAYGLVQSQAWSSILPRVRAERTRARARAGVAMGPWGRPRT